MPASAGKKSAAKATSPTYIVIEDGRLNRRMPDQPYNLAMVTLDEDPTVNFYSNLPGTPPYRYRWAPPSRSRSKKSRRAS